MRSRRRQRRSMPGRRAVREQRGWGDGGDVHEAAVERRVSLPRRELDRRLRSGDHVLRGCLRRSGTARRALRSGDPELHRDLALRCGHRHVPGTRQGRRGLHDERGLRGRAVLHDGRAEEVCAAGSHRTAVRRRWRGHDRVRDRERLSDRHHRRWRREGLRDASSARRGMRRTVRGVHVTARVQRRRLRAPRMRGRRRHRLSHRAPPS